MNILIVPFARANYSVLSSSRLTCWECAGPTPVIMGCIWESELGLRVVCESSILFVGVIAVIVSTVCSIAAGPSLWNVGALYPPVPDICLCTSDDAAYNALSLFLPSSELLLLIDMA